MKYGSMGRAALGVLLSAMAAGCEGERSAERPSEYDPKVDAPPTNLVVQPGKGLLEDQAMLASEVARMTQAAGKGGARGGAAGGVAENSNVVAVRGVMSKLIDAGKAGQFAETLQHVSPEDGQALQGTVAAMVERAAALAAFDKAAKGTLGLKEMPASIQQAMEKGPGGGPALAALGDMTTDGLSYRLDANNVIVTGRGTPLVFVKTGDAWLVRLSAEDKAMYAALADLMKAQTKFLTALTAVMGTEVTESNIDEKAIAAMGETVKPAMDKLKEAVEAAQKAAPGGAESTGAGGEGGTTPSGGGAEGGKPAAKDASSGS